MILHSDGLKLSNAAFAYATRRVHTSWHSVSVKIWYVKSLNENLVSFSLIMKKNLLTL